MSIADILIIGLPLFALVLSFIALYVSKTPVEKMGQPPSEKFRIFAIVKSAFAVVPKVVVVLIFVFAIAGVGTVAWANNHYTTIQRELEGVLQQEELLRFSIEELREELAELQLRIEVQQFEMEIRMGELRTATGG